MYDQDTFHLPTPEQLHSTSLMLDFDRGNIVAVSPIQELLDPIERYLPPAGQYYDQFTITLVKKFLAGNAKRCCSCWFYLRHGKTRSCKYTCLVCGTDAHHGASCHLIFASVKWWSEQGYPPKTSIQRRPNPREMVYLIITGVILYRPGMAYREPIVVNMMHPVVREFYNGAKPAVSLPNWMEDLTEKTLAAQPKPLPRPVKPEVAPLSMPPSSITRAAARPSRNAASPDITQEEVDKMFAKDIKKYRVEINKAEEAKSRREKKVLYRKEQAAKLAAAESEAAEAELLLRKAQDTFEEKKTKVEELKSQLT
jgi:hypothetical protein